MLKKITISDIADLVGVSKATVSYYLNGNFAKMSKETKEKIRQVIEVTGYQPSRIAQSLVKKDTLTIGVVIADITNPFISSVIKGIHDTCTKYGYLVNFANSDNNIQMELENLNRLNQQNVSGIILDSVDAYNPIIKTFDNRNMIMIDRQAKELTIDTVVSDNEKSTMNFLQKMQEAGYEDIYFVTYPIEGISTRELRYQGFQKIVSKDPEKLLVLGTEAIDKRIINIIANAKKKTAFFMMNGPTLLAFMQMINHTDYVYPRDFGLGSYEDLEWMEILSPNVSCIKQNSYELGCMAATRLIEKLKSDSPNFPPKLVEVKNQLVMRKSF